MNPRASLFLGLAILICQETVQGAVGLVAARKIAIRQRIAKTPEFARKIPMLVELESLQWSAADTASSAETLSDLGDVFFLLGQFDSAEVRYRKSLSLHRATGNLKGEVEALNHIGDALGMAGQLDSTRSYDELALALARKAGDRKGEGLSLRNLGDLFYVTSSADSAAVRYRRALELARSVNDSAGEALALTSMGNAYAAGGKFDTALSLHRASLSLYRKIGDPPEECAALNNIGDAFASLSLPDSATKYYKLSLDRSERIGYVQAQVYAINNLGEGYASRSLYDSAMIYLEKGLDLARRSGDPRLEATVSTNIGACHARLGRIDSAVASFYRALSVQEGLKDQDGIMATTNNLGTLYQLKGRPDSSLAITARTLDLARSSNRRNRLAGMIVNRGATFQFLGLYDSASACYRQALSIQIEQGDRAGAQISLNNLGTLFREWGNDDTAMAHYRRSLRMARELRDPAGEASALANSGVVWSHRGRFDSAISCVRASLKLRESIGDPREIGASYAGLGCIFQSSGNLDSALHWDRRAFSLFQEQGDVHGMEVSLNNIGTIWQGLGKPDSALTCYRKTLELARRTGDKVAEFHAQNNIGVLLDLLGKPDSATVPLESSIRILETLRETARGSLRRDYLASVIGVYANLATALMKAGRTDSSLSITERASARYLSEMLGRRSGEGIQYRGVVELCSKLPDSVLVVKFWSGDTSGRFTLRYVLSRRGLLDARVIDDTTVRSTAAAFRDDILSDRSTLESGARLRSALLSGMDSLLAHHRRMVIVPDGPYADIPWEALPMSDGKRLVQSVEVRRIQSLAILRHLLKRDSRTKHEAPLLAMGGAVYQTPGQLADPRVFENSSRALSLSARDTVVDSRVWLSGLRCGWRNLPGSLAEVRSISNVVTKSVLDTSWSVSESKIKQMSSRGDLNRFRVLHFAVHGLAHPWDQELNALVLSLPRDSSDAEDGYLTLREAADLRVSADLVVLSACQTGLGPKAGGEGSQTMVDAFLLAGASSVMATLWSVDDRATSRFMRESYGRALKDGIGLAEAMHRTQAEFLAGANRKGDGALDEEGRQQSKPRFWAPFVVYGL